MNSPPGPYDLNTGSSFASRPSADGSLEYSTNQESDAYFYGGGSVGTSITGQGQGHRDATETVKEMYVALLYLLSNPEEFQKAVRSQIPIGTTTLAEWNAEYADYEDDNESVLTSETLATPLPFVVFSDDAEVVLPQAHTASQLFGIEQVEGVELEAAAGVAKISQLFLRWLALMPQGDHLNTIDPPGLVCMKIAGGRYRVTAAHRCVWKWMNEFGPIGEPEVPSSPTQALQLGDLVSLVIVDVFETDENGRLLSYCPTFNNRAIQKTNQTTEALRKSSKAVFSAFGRAQRAVASSEVNKRATAQLKQMGIMQHAKMVAENMRHKVDEVVQNYHSPTRRVSHPPATDPVTDSKEFEQVLAAAEEAAAGMKPNSANDGVAIDRLPPGHKEERKSETFFPDDNVNGGDTGEI